MVSRLENFSRVWKKSINFRIYIVFLENSLKIFSQNFVKLILKKSIEMKNRIFKLNFTWSVKTICREKENENCRKRKITENKESRRNKKMWDSIGKLERIRKRKHFGCARIAFLFALRDFHFLSNAPLSQNIVLFHSIFPALFFVLLKFSRFFILFRLALAISFTNTKAHIEKFGRKNKAKGRRRRDRKGQRDRGGMARK